MTKKRVVCLILAACILLSAGAWAVWRQVQKSRAEYGTAEISVNGEVLYTYDLSRTYAAPERISIPDGTEENIIEIGTGYVRMVSASCPDQICVKTGQISKPGESIVCLPHRLIITIAERGTEHGDTVDAAA